MAGVKRSRHQSNPHSAHKTSWCFSTWKVSLRTLFGREETRSPPGFRSSTPCSNNQEDRSEKFSLPVNWPPLVYSRAFSLPWGPGCTSSAPRTLCAPSLPPPPPSGRRSRWARWVWSKRTGTMWTWAETSRHSLPLDDNAAQTLCWNLQEEREKKPLIHFDKTKLIIFLILFHVHTLASLVLSEIRVWNWSYRKVRSDSQ